MIDLPPAVQAVGNGLKGYPIDMADGEAGREAYAGITNCALDDLKAIRRLQGICMRSLDERDLSVLLDDIAAAAVEITGAAKCLIEIADWQTGRMHIARRPGAPDTLAGATTAIHGVTLLGRSGDKLGRMTLTFDGPDAATPRDLEFSAMLAKLTADIMERLNMEKMFLVSRQKTEMLYEVVGLLLENDPVQDIVEQLCNKVMQFLGCDIFFNYLVSKDKPNMMSLNACGGITAEQAREVETLEFGQAVCGLAAYKGERIIVEDMQSCNEDRVAILKGMGIRTYVCHPLLGRDAVMGTLSFGSRTKDSFDPSELELMRAVSNHVAAAVNRQNTENELRLIADEIREKSKLVTDYFTNLSHEFKTPLSIILVDLQLMEFRLRNAGGGTQEQLGKMVDVMRQNALRLLRLIGNLLDVTKIDAGYMTVRFAMKDIVGLTRDIVDSVRNYANNVNISLAFQSVLNERMMPVDAEKLERILLNLLSNSIKHTAEGGRIAVTMEHEDCCVTVTVEDNGEGIPDTDRELIFDRFKQVNASLTRASEGSGIGLSLTKALVELLQGRIWFESEYGKGSRFHFQLPVIVINETVRFPEAEGMTRDRKVEMEFSDIQKAGKAHL